MFGIPHAELGEQVHAVVQAPQGLPPTPALAEALLAFCRANLSHVKCPKRLEFTEQLPRQANGKLYKRLLKEKYWKG